MKKKESIVLIFTLSLLLSGCSLKQDAASLYKKEAPLESEIIIPESFSNNQKETIKVILTQSGKKISNPNYVHFEIWKQDGSVKYNMEPARNEGNGTYSLSKEFESNGLYYVRVHASNDNSIIMPKKQFIVGKLSKSELEMLRKGVQKQSESHQHHH